MRAISGRLLLGRKGRNQNEDCNILTELSVSLTDIVFDIVCVVEFEVTNENRMNGYFQ